MTLIRFPDGTERDVPDTEVAAAIDSGGSFSSDVAELDSQQSGPSMFEDPLGAANAAASGFFRGGALAAGDEILDNASELISQATDDYSLQNRMNEARYQHQGLETAGRILGNVVTGIKTVTTVPNAFGRLGAFGSAVATNAAEAAIIMAVDGAAESLSEDMLERPDITSEAMAANALTAAMWGGAGGLVLGGLGSATIMGVARGVGAVGRGLRGAADDAVDVAVRTLDDTPEGLQRAVSEVNTSTVSSPLSAAVRLAEREGVDVMTARVYREAVQEITDATRHVASIADIPENMIRTSMPDGNIAAQAAGTNVAIAAAQNTHEAMARVAVNEADNAALTVLNMARQRAIMGGEFNSLGRVAPEITRQLTTVNRLSNSLVDMSPAARQVAESYISKVNDVFSNEGIFGTAAANAARITDATATINTIRNAAASGTPLTREQLVAAAEAADTLAQSMSTGSVGKHADRLMARATQASERVRGAVSQVEQSLRVASLAREVAASRVAAGKMGYVENMAVEIGSRAVVGGNPIAGAMVERLYRGVREVANKRQLIHQAQNMYQGFRTRSAQSLLKFSANPRPVVAHLEFSPQAYAAAVDAVKRSADIPVNRRTPTPRTEFAGAFEPVPFKVEDIPAERGTVRDAPLSVQRRRQALADTIPPASSQVSGARTVEPVTIPPPSRARQDDTGVADATIPPPTRRGAVAR